MGFSDLHKRSEKEWKIIVVFIVGAFKEFPRYVVDL